MATIEQIARHIDAIDEPDMVLRLHAIAKAISDDFAPGYMPRFNEYPEPSKPLEKDQTMNTIQKHIARIEKELAGIRADIAGMKDTSALRPVGQDGGSL